MSCPKKTSEDRLMEKKKTIQLIEEAFHMPKQYPILAPDGQALPLHISSLSIL